MNDYAKPGAFRCGRGDLSVCEVAAGEALVLAVFCDAPKPLRWL